MESSSKPSSRLDRIVAGFSKVDWKASREAFEKAEDRKAAEARERVKAMTPEDWERIGRKDVADELRKGGPKLVEGTIPATELKPEAE